MIELRNLSPEAFNDIQDFCCALCGSFCPTLSDACCGSTRDDMCCRACVCSIPFIERRALFEWADAVRMASAGGH